VIAEGYFIEENVLSDAECDWLIEILSLDGIQRSRAGVRNLMHLAAVSEFASDRRLMAFTEHVYGKTLIPYKATLFEKSGKANWLVAWHQDTALPLERFDGSDGWGATSIKAGIHFAHAPASALSKIFALRIHLDASTKHNGPLRVIKGSHSFGVLSDREIERYVKKGEIVECLTGRGSVLAMSPLLLHASSKTEADLPRRVLHIEYAESLDIENGIRLAVA
jgi:ectoine hydroxylase-related dioxygenase (phytanoyl-CoA dioxygenase family)